MNTTLPNIHPGEILLEEFLRPLHLSQNAAARAMGIPPRRINEICLKKRGVTADAALKLSEYFGTTPHFWLGLQNDYEVEETRRSAKYRPVERYQPSAYYPTAPH